MSKTCEECKHRNEWYWCNTCNAEQFQRNFKNWSSGNDDIDKFIQHTQLSATDYSKVLEWIPYDRFHNIEYIAKGGFGKVYKAKWIDGYIDYWDNKNQNWKRRYPNKDVALKSLNNSKNVTLEFIKEITSHHKISDRDYGTIIRFYGITQDPDTKNYMMVLDYAENGSLRNYLDTNVKLSWNSKISTLYNVADGLNTIHANELIHRDLHIGNILHTGMRSSLFVSPEVCITDMGLCKPADYIATENTKNSTYGVLPYIAPEILRGQNYTKAADIYSFGIIMYEVISGLPPYHDVGHDQNLALKICQGLRPRFDIKVPQLIVHLIKRCLDANQLNRPTASEISNILGRWDDELIRNPVHEKAEETEIIKQIKEANAVNNKLQTSNVTLTSLSYKTHSEAIYTSRLLNFNNLPEPKNSDDYYKQYDNIISTECSGK
ncbi:kinase-like domain-containing protein [Glomus cerebriforme]|uniref:Kinase-like domain-containing protein n=1 Tax=Glomus cerebriforme TaxID=658196 RepID=A0A397SED9_9GLOM|nr:kinase-like domain-containing protein [Glomus cerebriforme]